MTRKPPSASTRTVCVVPSGQVTVTLPPGSAWPLTVKRPVAASVSSAIWTGSGAVLSTVS
ncbi:Uncharacterised protein [Bordetella pertussis]|nr:Uncharacterised protein [Bordetella pertussis]